MGTYDHDNADENPGKFFPMEPCSNPAVKGWTAAFVVDVALGTSDETLCDSYELQYHELSDIKADPLFILQLASVQKELKKDGVSFKLKAALQSEALLETSWALIHSPATPPSVKAALIKDTVRWAGLDAPAVAAEGARGGFSVNIILNGTQSQNVLIEQPVETPT